MKNNVIKKEIDFLKELNAHVSDYKLGLEDTYGFFAKENGGIDKLREEMFEWHEIYEAKFNTVHENPFVAFLQRIGIFL